MLFRSIVNHQHLLQRYPVIVKYSDDRPAAPVHEGCGLQQPALAAPHLNTADMAMELRFRPEFRVVSPGKRVDKPKTGIVASPGILRSRIAETNDKTNGRGHLHCEQAGSIPPGLDL